MVLSFMGEIVEEDRTSSPWKKCRSFDIAINGRGKDEEFTP